jgi:hypothetical protein
MKFMPPEIITIAAHYQNRRDGPTPLAIGTLPCIQINRKTSFLLLFFKGALTLE